MFYIKTRRGTRIPIEDGDGGNVFTQCPACSKEFEVSLSELIFEESLDLYSTQVYCHKCSVERARKHPEEPGAEMVAREAVR